MQTFRDINTITGFRFEQPIDDFPALTHCGEQSCTARHFVPWHKHTCHELVYIMHGSASWRVGKNSFSHSDGDLFISYPDEWHCSGVKRTPGYHILFAGIALPSLGQPGVMLSRQLHKEKIRVIRQIYDLEPLLRGLIHQAASRVPQRREVSESYLHTIVALLLQRIDKNSSQELPAGEGPYGYMVEKTIAFMRQHCDQRLSVADLSAVAGFSPSQFTLRFRQEVGLPPGAYHMRLRLEAARKFLADPENTLTMAATHYGFSSVQHFVSAFTEEFRISPGRYQKAMRRSS